MNNIMNYKGYTASMMFDTIDKIIVGRVLDIEDIITFHGESISEFEANFHAVIDSYLSACAKLDEIEESISPNLMLNIAPTVYAAMLKTAARNGVSLQQWAEQVLKIAAN